MPKIKVPFKYWSGHIYPNYKLPHKVRIIITQNRKEFTWIWHNILGLKEGPGDTMACWMHNPVFLKKKGGVIKNEVGIILLCRTSMRRRDVEADYVSHECMHATLAYMRALKKLPRIMKRMTENQKRKWGDSDPKRIPEEFACYSHGWLVRRIIGKLNQIRIAEAKTPATIERARKADLRRIGREINKNWPE